MSEIIQGSKPNSVYEVQEDSKSSNSGSVKIKLSAYSGSDTNLEGDRQLGLSGYTIEMFKDVFDRGIIIYNDGSFDPDYAGLYNFSAYVEAFYDSRNEATHNKRFEGKVSLPDISSIYADSNGILYIPLYY